METTRGIHMNSCRITYRKVLSIFILLALCVPMNSYALKQTNADQREIERWSGVDDIELDFEAEEQYIYTWLEDRINYTDSLVQYEDFSDIHKASLPSNNVRKYYQNGQILILRSDKTYTLMGQKVK